MTSRPLLLLLWLCFPAGAVYAQSCAYTYTFSNGTTADASQVNTNFNDLAQCVSGGATAGTFTTLAASGAIRSTGANLANEASAVKLSQESSSASYLTAYGANPSTQGTFSISLKSSNGGVQSTPFELSAASLSVFQKHVFAARGLTLGTGTDVAALTLDSDGAANYGAGTIFKKDGAQTGIIGHRSYITGGGSTASDLAYFAEAGLGHVFMVNGLITSVLALNTSGGAVLGNPGGSAPGAGYMNVSGGIYLNGTAYTNPDYVLEKWATGSIVKFADKKGASDYRGLMPLSDVKAYARANLHLPRFGQEAKHDIFSGSDALLASLEEAYLYLFQLRDELDTYKAAASGGASGTLIPSTAKLNAISEKTSIAPRCTSNCGTSPSCVGTDSAMRCTMGATGIPGSNFVITFNRTWDAPPSCIVQAAKSGMASAKKPIVAATTRTTITVTTDGMPPGNSDVYNAICMAAQ